VQYNYLYIIILLITFACNKGKNNDDSCNGSSTRREIKLAIDDDAIEIDTIPTVTTVDSLGALNLIKAKSDTKRQAIEKKIFTVTALVDKVSKYRDGDYKVKFISDNGNYLNCEFPNIGCSHAKSSRYYEQLKTVRAFIEQNKDDLEGKFVTITGIAFIDIAHNYPRKAPKNQIELHPVLDISFN